MELELIARLGKEEGLFMIQSMQLVNFAMKLPYDEKGIKVRLKNDNSEADPRSIMQVISLAARPETEIKIVVSGAEKRTGKSELEKIGSYFQSFLENNLKDYDLLKEYHDYCSENPINS